MRSFVSLLIFACILVQNNFVVYGKLYQVVSMFRHGARYHLSDTLDGKDYRAVWRELTPVGMKQHENFGKILRNEYINNLNFLSDKYNKSEMQIYSTYANRTIDSAVSQMYGLYPSGNGQRLTYVQRKYHLPPFSNQTDLDQQNFALPEGHQPIIIKYDDDVQIDQCPNLDAMKAKNRQDHAQQLEQMNLTYYPFYKKIGQIFNVSTQKAGGVFGALNVDLYLGQKIFNDNFTRNDYDNLQHLANFGSNIGWLGMAATVTNNGKFIKILKQFDARIKNINTYPLKWSFLSGHDTDLFPAQIGLNISSYQCIEQLWRKGSYSALNCQKSVDFATNIIIELHSDNERDFYVMVRSQGKYMNLCEKKSTKCSYDEFKKRLKHMILTQSQWNKACGFTQEQIKNKNKLKQKREQATIYDILSSSDIQLKYKQSNSKKNIHFGKNNYILAV